MTRECISAHARGEVCVLFSLIECQYVCFRLPASGSQPKSIIVIISVFHFRVYIQACGTESFHRCAAVIIDKLRLGYAILIIYAVIID